MLRKLAVIVVLAVLPACAVEMYSPSMTSGERRLAANAPAESNAAASAPSAPVVTADAAPDAPQNQNRLVVYNASFALVVPDIRQAQQSVIHLASSLGGYLQELDANTVTIRLPATHFSEALPAIEKLGAVADRRIKANDVTEEMRDLQIRLDNAQHVRDRLTALIDKSPRIEDTIKLEQELERVTESIELLKGKIQYLSSQLAFSTIRVAMNSPRPQTDSTAALPFPWVRDLASGAIAGETQLNPDTNRFWPRNDRFKLPAGFVRYFEKDHITEAMSADGIVIKLERHDNYDGGDIHFWATLTARFLIDSRALAIEKESDTALSDKTPAHVIVAIKDLGTSKQSYLLALASTKRYVYTFEAWGPADKFQQQVAGLQQAFESLDAKHW